MPLWPAGGARFHGSGNRCDLSAASIFIEKGVMTTMPLPLLGSAWVLRWIGHGPGGGPPRGRGHGCPIEGRGVGSGRRSRSIVCLRWLHRVRAGHPNPLDDQR